MTERKLNELNIFLHNAENLYGSIYDYSQINLMKKKKIKIGCKEHGYFFEFPSKHLNGFGCPTCQFIKLSFEAHTKYDYSKVIYKDESTQVEILCPEHSSFWQRPYSHKQGNGCPKCKESKGERRIREYLENINIPYIQEFILPNKKRIDFYIEEINLGIEFDGKQHFEDIKFFDSLQIIQERDKLKNQYCKDNNIDLLRIPYWDFNKIEKIILCKIKGT